MRTSSCAGDSMNWCCRPSRRRHNVAHPRKPRASKQMDARNALVIGVVTGLLRDVQISDENDFETLLAEITNHACKIRELLAVHGEWGIALLVVDIQVNHVARNLVLTEGASNFAYPRFGVVAVSGLLESQRPHRRQRTMPYQRRE